jgi:hypothetical protein
LFQFRVAEALRLARADLRPIVVEGAEVGGALMTTTAVGNYPGFADGILGPDLMDAMRRQAVGFGAIFLEEDGTAVSLTGPVKTVTTADRVLRSDAVILATGSRITCTDSPPITGSIRTGIDNADDGNAQSARHAGPRCPVAAAGAGTAGRLSTGGAGKGSCASHNLGSRPRYAILL